MDTDYCLTLLVIGCIGIVKFGGIEAYTFNVKLGQTSTSNTGRLEVQKESTDGNTSLWGTVCANGFGDTEATVVCHQLGYVKGRAQNDVYKDAGSTFVLADISCTGNETELAQCSHSPWMKHHCLSNRNYYVGVCCSNASSFGEYNDGYFESHCKESWAESIATCARRGQQLASSNISTRDVTYWSNDMYSPWIAGVGCFRFDTTSNVSSFELTLNSPGRCVQFCQPMNGAIRFALSGQLCICLNDQQLQRVKSEHCQLKCQGNDQQYCGDKTEYASVYTTVPNEMFIQYSTPSSETQCALLQNTQQIGKKRLRSEDCENKNGFVCMFLHYKQDQDSSEEREEYDIRFITPGGRKIIMSNVRRKCKDTSTEFAGWDAVRSNDMHLNTPSWVDVSRYVISNIRNNEILTSLSPTWCIAVAVDTSGHQRRLIEDCSARHSFICEKVETDTLGSNNTSRSPEAVHLTTTTVETRRSTFLPRSTLSTSSTNDHIVLPTVITTCGSCLIIMALSLVGLCIRYRHWKRRKHSLDRSISSYQQRDFNNEGVASSHVTEDNTVYCHTYDTVTEDKTYSKISDVDHSKPPIVTEECGYSIISDVEHNASQAKVKPINSPCFQDSGQCHVKDINNHVARESGVEMDNYYKLSAVYRDPEDSIELRKNILTHKKSSTSYVYPYDSLPRK